MTILVSLSVRKWLTIAPARLVLHAGIELHQHEHLQWLEVSWAVWGGWGRIHDLKGAGWSLMEDWWWRISCWRTQTSLTYLWTCIDNTSDFSENERISMFESADLLIETVWLLRRSWSISSSWLSKRLIRTLFSFENKPVFFYVLTTVVFSKYIEKHTFCSPGEHCNSFD